MKTVKTTPEFVALSDDEISKALDEFEALLPDDEEELDPNATPSNPIVEEVARLIGLYTDRFDEYCEKNDEIPVEIYSYEPEVAIERAAYEIFLDALHDELQEMDEDE